MDYNNRAEQAVDGLDVTAAGGVVLVDDGHTKWLAPEKKYDAVFATMARMPPRSDTGNESCADAYTELCARIGAGDKTPIAALDGGCGGGPREARHVLIRQALEADLIDEDTARRMGLPV